MLKLLTCVQGHFWEIAQPSENGERADNASYRCPVCGAPADELPLIDLAPSETEPAPAPAPAAAAPPPAPKAPPLLDAKGEPVVTGYDILKALGKNKKGVLVFRAKQTLINRTVLLKVVMSKDDVGQAAWGALRGEANALAKIAHPNVPEIYEVGERERQLFYNVVEHFDGVPLSEWAQGTPVPPAQAAKFVEGVARALHAAHQQNVVHRSLKPASILVEADADKTLDRYDFKVVDFGLAGRPVEGDVNDVELQEKLPHYLSPEQAWGYAKDIGPCSDVYALGVLLYELLTGRPPFRGERASEVIEQIRSRAPTPPREINRRVPADLDAVCRKCLQKPPRKRYGSALELADDLRRYWEGVPVTARDTGVVSRLVKWVARRPAAALILTLMFLAFVSTLVAYFVGSGRADSEARRREAAEARELAAQGESNRLKREADQARERELLAAYYLDVARADAMLKEKRPAAAIDLLNHTSLNSRRFEWYYLIARAHNAEPRSIIPAGPIVCLALSPDGRFVAAGADTPLRGTVFVWETSGGNQRYRWQFNGRVRDLAFSPDGGSLAVVSSDLTDNKGQLDVYGLGSGFLVRQVPFQQQRPTSVTYSPDGKHIAGGSNDGRPWVVVAAEGRKITVGQFGVPGFDGDQELRVAFSADGERLAWCRPGSTEVIVWGIQTGSILPSLHCDRGVTALAYAIDGHVVTGSADGAVTVWDVAFQPRRSEQGHNGAVRRVQLSQDGKRLATLGAGQDGKVRMRWYDGETLREILTVSDFPADADAQRSFLALDKDGRLLAVASQTEIRLYGPK
jgi:hypothetical protein